MVFRLGFEGQSAHSSTWVGTRPLPGLSRDPHVPLSKFDQNRSSTTLDVAITEAFVSDFSHVARQAP